MVTDDEYELPLIVTDSLKELAKLTGKDSKAISKAMYAARTRGSKSRFHRIMLDDD